MRFEIHACTVGLKRRFVVVLTRAKGADIQATATFDGVSAMQGNHPQELEQEPIKILGVMVDEVGVPRNDSSPGSALYEVPFQLSRQPSEQWTEFFTDTWNRPPFTISSMHRPGIARVEGDRIVLDGTTIEEVERYHVRTLKLAVDRANELSAKWRQSREERKKDLGHRQQEHRRRVKEVAKRLKFD
ncbi:MAG TPA: hypothetical protein VN754_13335 [Candidatus Binataceae bacterium]|nr:hypothetical protein [Candidatus Binataceae bacterium]